MTDTKYKRIILKLSGESFAAPGERGISMDEVVHIAREIKDAHSLGCQIAVVIGGGNILRGSQFTAKNDVIHESTAHYMGMMATIINGLALQDGLEAVGCDTRLMSAIRMDGVCEPYIRRRAQRHLDKGRIVILGAGTGGPFVTTDTAAALRSMELEANILLKATRVDGVYSEDPEKKSPRRAVPGIGLCHGTGKGLAGDGFDRDFTLHGTQDAAQDFQLQNARKYQESGGGRQGGDHDSLNQSAHCGTN